MRRHRVISPERQQGSPVNVLIGKKILIDKKALVRISAPDPLIPLNSINEKNTAAQPERMHADFPDPVQKLIITGKRRFHRNVHVLVDRTHGDILLPAVRDKSIAHRTARRPPGRIELPAVITVLRIQRLLPGLAAENPKRCSTVCGR